MQLFNHQAAKDGIEYIVDIRNISMFFPSLISIEWSKVKHANAYIIAFHTHIYIYIPYRYEYKQYRYRWNESLLDWNMCGFSLSSLNFVNLPLGQCHIQIVQSRAPRTPPELSTEKLHEFIMNRCKISGLGIECIRIR